MPYNILKIQLRIVSEDYLTTLFPYRNLNVVLGYPLYLFV